MYGQGIKKTCGSHSMFLGGAKDEPGAYEIYVDEEFLEENIEPG